MNKTGFPVVCRGVTNTMDALRCAAEGAAAIWVTSNFESGASPITVMKKIIVTLRGNHWDTEVFLSGGIRRGTDVLKAIALGATCVFLDPETSLWALYHG